jgi:acetyl-CoA/propionyl-CoA carboxylase, biotin carboxylase, biotin carboxyl carrier protein
VQVLGDRHGAVIHLFERECSVQRRFQKIVEESPSPGISPQERERICAAAAGIARAARYSNAGTVEFVYGGGEFYFLEMNTRLQVEHPVTEMVTGIDLVAEQIRIAAGEPLRLTQDSIRPRGHAVELRLYAESPSRGFAPTTGRILALDLPQGDGIRVDCGVAPGQRITAAFDPVLAKLVAHGADRGEAIARARAAVAEFALLGCETNAAFLARLLDDPTFRAGEVHTGTLDERPELAPEPEMSDAARRRVLAAAALATRAVLDAADAVPDLHAAMGAWRN